MNEQEKRQAEEAERKLLAEMDEVYSATQEERAPEYPVEPDVESLLQQMSEPIDVMPSQGVPEAPSASAAVNAFSGMDTPGPFKLPSFSDSIDTTDKAEKGFANQLSSISDIKPGSAKPPPKKPPATHKMVRGKQVPIKPMAGPASKSEEAAWAKTLADTPKPTAEQQHKALADADKAMRTVVPELAPPPFPALPMENQTAQTSDIPPPPPKRPAPFTPVNKVDWPDRDVYGEGPRDNLDHESHAQAFSGNQENGVISQRATAELGSLLKDMAAAIGKLQQDMQECRLMFDRDIR